VPHELEGGVGLEGDVGTQTGAPDSHGSSSFAAACAAAGESSTRAKPEKWIALEGEAPTIDVAVGYSKSNTSPILKLFLSRLDELMGPNQKH